MRRLFAFQLVLILALAASLACNAAALAPASPTPPPTPTPTLPPVPTDAGWETVAPGLELRAASIPTAGSTVPVTLVRVDPAHYALRLHYDAANPSTISAWQVRTSAALVVNGGFFTPENDPLGMLVIDGERIGQSFNGFGGMLSVSEGVVGVRALSQEPYSPGEALEQAVQGRPVLLYPGGTPADFDFPTEPNRRTAVALDTSGRLVFVLVDRGAVSLYALRDWLFEQTEFDVHAALNLDGGGSTGMALAVSGQARLIDSWTPLPIVLAFYPVE